MIAAVPGNDLANVRANPALTVSTMQSNRCFFWSVDVDRDAPDDLAGGEVERAVRRAGRHQAAQAVVARHVAALSVGTGHGRRQKKASYQQGSRDTLGHSKKVVVKSGKIEAAVSQLGNAGGSARSLQGCAG